MKYAVVDIETNGGVKITEICIFIFDGTDVVDEFTTLVNPQCNIPPRITDLTGIDNPMVRKSPTFKEIATKIEDITKDCIFVAHNVNFDYGIIGKEFKELGLKYERKNLCTIRIARKLLPNKVSYSLGRLCLSEEIEVKNRHRAKGDVEATVILFKKLLKLDALQEYAVLNSFLKPDSKEVMFPPLLTRGVFDSLPNTQGVYYFWNTEKEVVYLEKAANIKESVLHHFCDKKKKARTICSTISNITYSEIGNQLLAFLIEYSELKRLSPVFNKRQKLNKETYGVFSYEDRKGILHMASNTLKSIPKPFIKCYSKLEAKKIIESLQNEYQLCYKYCNIKTKECSCLQDEKNSCKGVCIGKESIEDYNIRVQEAIGSVTFKLANFIIKQEGRNKDEFSYVLVLDGQYKGYGFLTNKEMNYTIESYMEGVISHESTREIHQVLHSYIKENPKTVSPL